MPLFPSNPANGQTANVNGYQFTFSTSDNAWNRTQSFTGNLAATTVNVSGNTNVSNLNLTGNIVDTGALSIITGANGNINLNPNGTGITIVNSALSATGNAILASNLAVGTTLSSWSGVSAIELPTAGMISAKGGLYINDNLYFTGGWRYSTTAAATQYVMGAGLHYWNTAGSGSANGNVTLTEVMRLDAGGNLTIGSSIAPTTSKLDVQGVTRSRSGYFIGAGEGYLYESATSQVSIRSGSNPNYKFWTFNNNGNGEALSGSWVSFSDRQSKENIEPISNGLPIVMNMNPVSYNRIGNEEKEIGFIAQELQPILPEVVATMTGNRFGVNYGAITSILCKAIQEQQEIIQTQQQTINDLQNTINSILERLDALENK